MLFGVIYFILCGINQTRGRGVNIISMASINCVVCISETDITVGGVNDGRYVSIFWVEVNNILARARDKGWFYSILLFSGRLEME